MSLFRRLEIKARSWLRLPIDYTNEEFQAIKKTLDWSRIPEQRIEVLASVFNVTPEVVSGLVRQAETIDVDEEDHDGGIQGVGSPMGRTDRITLYCAVRLAKPAVVVETGTAAGASSCYILHALQANGEGGVLHSVDATPDRTNVGRLVPDSLRGAYQLHAGNSLEVLDQVFRADEAIDLFLHDSRHTYQHMMAEYQWAWRHTHARSVLCSHDVLMGNVWAHFIRRHHVQRHGIVKNFGIALLAKS